MNSVEISGKSIEEATALAAEKLGVSASDIKVDVLDQSKGLFGKTTVKIRATAATAAVAVAEPEPKPVEAAAAPVEEAVAAPAKEKPAAKGKKPAKKAEAAESTGDEGAPAEDTYQATEAEANDVKAVLDRIVAAGGLEVTTKVSSINGKYINLELDGKDAAHLIGKQGEVLNTLQYLVNIIVARKVNNNVRASIDGNNYRTRREESLTKLATNIANAVIERGQEAVLDALPAFERRIVHKALSVIPGVVTYSEGEEPHRRVVIAPAD